MRVLQKNIIILYLLVDSTPPSQYKKKLKNIENTFFNSHFFLSLRHIGKAYKNKRHKLTKDKEQFSRME